MPPIEYPTASNTSTGTCTPSSIDVDGIAFLKSDGASDVRTVSTEQTTCPQTLDGAESEQGNERLDWEYLVMFLTVAPMAGYTVVQPYQQTRRDELGCGPICVGTMTSVSSLLGLIGAPLVGALSDRQGRQCALAIGCITGALSFIILALTNSLVGLWIAMIPPALLSHNFTITKAVVADLATPAQRAGVLGKLGLAAGLGFMAGPFIQPFISDYIQATIIATMLHLLAIAAVTYLPSKRTGANKPIDQKAETNSGSIVYSVFNAVAAAVQEVFMLAIAAPAAAKVMLFLRFGLSMGFYVFFTVMSVIMKDRFQYGPTEYSNYFAFVGLVYSISQLLSKNLINRWSSNPTSLVVLCIFFLMTGRLITAITSSHYVLYLGVSVSITALGVLNNTINTNVAHIAGSGQVGGLMGVLDTAEKLAGVCGPTLGGFLYAYHSLAPVVAVTAGYVTLMATMHVCYPRFVIPVLTNTCRDKDD